MSRSIQDNRNIKTVETEKLQIEGHLMKWSDVVIQINNISMITAAKLPAPRFPTWAVLMLIAGTFVYASSSGGGYYGGYYRSSQENLTLIGAAFLALVGVAGLLRWLIEWIKTVGHKYLQILLNSGYVYALYIPDQEFLQKVLSVFENILRDGGKVSDHIQINISNSTITGAVAGKVGGVRR